MAIPYGTKLFETTTVFNPRTALVGSVIPAGTLIVLALGGTRSGSLLDITSVTDSAGNTWSWKVFASSISLAGVAWTRTNSTMAATASISVKWNGMPTKSWISAHTFTGASGTATDSKTNTGTSSTGSVTLSVSGSDWLTFGVITTPYDYGVTITPINSSLSRDDNAANTEAPWAEAFSRNGTTGSTHTLGGTFVISLPWRAAGVSFPFQSSAGPPAGVTRSGSGVIGV